MSLAAQLDHTTDLLKVLRNGGAHLDFRTRDGLTAVHCATRQRNAAALTVSGKGEWLGLAMGAPPQPGWDGTGVGAWPEGRVVGAWLGVGLDVGGMELGCGQAPGNWMVGGWSKVWAWPGWAGSDPLGC